MEARGAVDRLSPEPHSWGERTPDTLLKLYVSIQNRTDSEEGQDLVEYALLCSLIALTCIAGIQPIASSIKSVFVSLSSSLA